MANTNQFASVQIWSAADGKLRRVTDESFNSSNPAWDPQGNYLYYLSDHEFAPQLSNIEFNFATNRPTYIYALALRKDVKHPFPPESDEVTVTKSAEDGPRPAMSPSPPDKPGETPSPAASPAPTAAPAAAPAEAKPEAAPPKPPATMTIDFDGLSGRIARVPLGADNYFGLNAKTGHLLYVVGGAGYYGRQSDRNPSLRIYSLKDRKETTLVDDMRGYVLSDDGSKVLVAQGPGWNLYDATPIGERSRKAVSTAGLFVDRVPAEEWNQIFDEVWRRYRDWFYVSNMHGYDWAALREQYRPLLKYVAHRSDLNYVISEMISELVVQHAYIEGGDFQIPPRPRSGLPGARFELDKQAGRYRIAKIFGGDNAEDLYRSPLREVGVNVSVGDYVLAIDGE
jgi:tricorn protease